MDKRKILCKNMVKCNMSDVYKLNYIANKENFKGNVINHMKYLITQNFRQLNLTEPYLRCTQFKKIHIISAFLIFYYMRGIVEINELTNLHLYHLILKYETLYVDNIKVKISYTLDFEYFLEFLKLLFENSLTLLLRHHQIRLLFPFNIIELNDIFKRMFNLDPIMGYYILKFYENVHFAVK